MLLASEHFPVEGRLMGAWARRPCLRRREATPGADFQRRERPSPLAAPSR